MCSRKGSASSMALTPAGERHLRSCRRMTKLVAQTTEGSGSRSKLLSSLIGRNIRRTASSGAGLVCWPLTQPWLRSLTFRPSSPSVRSLEKYSGLNQCSELLSELTLSSSVKLPLSQVLRAVKSFMIAWLTILLVLDGGGFHLAQQADPSLGRSISKKMCLTKCLLWCGTMLFKSSRSETSSFSFL